MYLGYNRHNEFRIYLKDFKRLAKGKITVLLTHSYIVREYWASSISPAGAIQAIEDQKVLEQAVG